MRRLGSYGIAPLFALGLSACASVTPTEPALTAKTVMTPPGTVHLLRDQWGLPHLYAQREEDGYFGLGYALAEDRLEQVLLTYLHVSGRLAEFFGAGPLANKPGLSPEIAGKIQDTIATDMKMRQARHLEDARRNLSRLSPAYRANMEAFAEGMNRYMADHPEKIPTWAFPVEAAMPLAVYAAFTNGDPTDTCTSKFAAAETGAKLHGEENAAMASNAWVVAADRSATGEVLFSSDSHGGLGSNGPLFYAWRMKAGGLDVLSHDFTGSAAMVLAHSAHFAWGWTEGPRFVGDCYKVRVDPKNPHSYTFDGKERHIEQLPYTILVKDGDPVTGVFEYTDHNGVRSPVVRRTDDAVYVASVSYTGRAGLADQQYYEMAHAQTGDAFLAELDSREIYPANLIAGGRDGTILYIRPGRIPVRKEADFVHRILDGNTAATAWDGIHALKDLVQLRNPDKGYVANANVSPDMMYPAALLRAEDYPTYFAFLVGQINDRQKRLVALLEASEKMTFEDAVAITLDTKILGTDLWRDAIASAIRDHAPHFAHQGAAQAAFLDHLTGFDGYFTASSKGALYHVYFREVLIADFPDDVDAIVNAVETHSSLSAEQSKMIARAVETAYRAISQEFGHVDLTFGDAHRISRGNVSHASGGAVIAIGKNLPHRRSMIFNGQQLSVGAALHANIFQKVDGSPARLLDAGVRAPFVVRFSDPVQSHGLLAYGQSNDPASPHYMDQAKLYEATSLKSNNFDFSELSAHIVSSKRLSRRAGQDGK